MICEMMLKIEIGLHKLLYVKDSVRSKNLVRHFRSNQVNDSFELYSTVFHYFLFPVVFALPEYYFVRHNRYIATATIFLVLQAKNSMMLCPNLLRLFYEYPSFPFLYNSISPNKISRFHSRNYLYRYSILTIPGFYGFCTNT